MSSIMEESPETFKVFIALLAACGPNGIAPVSETYLVSVCRLPEAVVARAIKKLSFPDPKSRTLTDQGRRIRRVDGGFFIINYLKFREKGYSMTSSAIRKRKYRETRNAQSLGLGKIPSIAEAEAEAECPGHVPRCPTMSQQPLPPIPKDTAWEIKDKLQSLRLKILDSQKLLDEGSKWANQEELDKLKAEYLGIIEELEKARGQ